MATRAILRRSLALSATGAGAAGVSGAATSAAAVGACSVEGVDPASAIPPWPDVAARIAHGWPRLHVDIDLGHDVTVERDHVGTLMLLP